MKGLVQKLDKALSDANGLPGPQRQYLVRYVQDEVRRYAEKYCAAVLVQHRGYVFPGGALSSTRGALLDLVTPNGSLTTHLKGIADNANLTGLESRFTQPLSACLGQLRPVVTLMTPGKEGGYPGLKGYGEIIAGILKEIDTGKPADTKEDGKTPGLAELLSPLGRMSLAVLGEQEASPERKVEAFLEAQGMAGPLAPPFLAPVQHLTRLGLAELDSALKQHWEETLQPTVNPLLGRYPFDARADRELQAAELDLLKPGSGTFWQTFRAIYGPVAVEQDGRWLPRKWPRGTVALPPGMLALVNQLAQLSTQIFAKDGARKPISIDVRPLPIQACENDTPATVSVLSVSKQRLFGTNSRPAVSVFAIPWWEQEVSSVSLEFGKGAGQHAAQSIEVADSQWSFFRLLERATEARGVYTWTLPSEGGRTPCEVRFELLSNPLSLFRLNRR